MDTYNGNDDVSDQLILTTNINNTKITRLGDTCQFTDPFQSILSLDALMNSV